MDNTSKEKLTPATDEEINEAVDRAFAEIDAEWLTWL